MYELKLTLAQQFKFVKQAKKILKSQGKSIGDLAEELGRPDSTVYKFFALSNNNRFLAAEIRDYLQMKGWDGNAEKGNQ